MNEPIQSISNINIKVKTKDSTQAINYNVDVNNGNSNQYQMNRGSGQNTNKNSSGRQVVNYKNSDRFNQNPLLKNQPIRQMTSIQKHVVRKNSSLIMRQSFDNELRSNKSSLILDQSSSIEQTRNQDIKQNPAGINSSPVRAYHHHNRVLSQPNYQQSSNQQQDPYNESYQIMFIEENEENLSQRAMGSPQFRIPSLQKDSLQGFSVTGVTSDMISPMVSQRYENGLNQNTSTNQNIQPLSQMQKFSQRRDSNMSQSYKINSQALLNQENMIIMKLKDGQETFEITGKEVQLFRKMKKMYKKQLLKTNHAASGSYKQVMKQKGLGHLSQNIHPIQGNKLSSNLDKKVQSRDFEKTLMFHFFNEMRKQGLGKIQKDVPIQRHSVEHVIENPIYHEKVKEFHIDALQPDQKVINNQNVETFTHYLNSQEIQSKSGQSQNLTTYTVFKRLSKHYKHSREGQANFGLNQSLQYANNIKRGAFEASKYKSENSSVTSYSPRHQDQENIDLKNLIHINSMNSMKTNEFRPFSAFPVQGSMLSNQHLHYNRYGFQNEDSQNIIKPLLAQSQNTLKKDASIQNDDQFSNTQNELSSPSLRETAIINDRPDTQIIQHNEILKQKQNKQKSQQRPKSQQSKPLWIISTSKHKRLTVKEFQNHKGNLIQAHQQVQHKLQQKIQGLKDLTRVSSPTNYFNLNHEISFDKQTSNPIHVRTYQIDILNNQNQDMNQGLYIPKLKNNQISKYYHNQNQSKQAQLANIKKDFHKNDEQIQPRDSNGLLQQTPMFADDDESLLQYLDQEELKDKVITLDAKEYNDQNIVEKLRDDKNSNKSSNTMQKKNILLSKKSLSQGLSPLLPSSLQQSPTNPIQITLTPQQQANELINLPLDQEQHDVVLLEHIREETGESFDSGHAESSHTMQSNFKHFNQQMANNQLQVNNQSFMLSGNENQDETLYMIQRSTSRQRKSPQISKSFNNSQINVIQEDEADFYMNEVHQSLTQRDYFVNENISATSNSLKMIIKQNNISAIKSKSINEEPLLNQLQEQNLQSSQSMFGSKVIYRNRERMIRKKSSSQKFHNQFLKQTLLDFTNINLNQDSSNGDFIVTRNLSQMPNRNTSKTPTTRVISKIHGNTVNGQPPQVQALNNDITQNLHMAPSNAESQSSYDNFANAANTIQGERDGFLDTPIYLMKQGQIQTQIHVNGPLVKREDSINQATFNALSFEGFSSLINNRKESSFDLNAGQGAEIEIFGFAEKMPEDIKNLRQQQFSVRYTHNKNEDMLSSDYGNMYQRMNSKRKTEIFQSNLANIMEIASDILPNQTVLENQTEFSINRQSFQNYSLMSMPSHKRQYKQRLDKKYDEMLKRNMSVFRRASNRSFNGSLDTQQREAKLKKLMLQEQLLREQGSQMRVSHKDFSSDSTDNKAQEYVELPHDKNRKQDFGPLNQDLTQKNIQLENDYTLSNKDTITLGGGTTTKQISLASSTKNNNAKKQQQQQLQSKEKVNPFIQQSSLIKSSNKSSLLNINTQAYLNGLSLRDYFNKQSDQSILPPLQDDQLNHISSTTSTFAKNTQNKVSFNKLKQSSQAIQDLSTSQINESVMTSKLLANQSMNLNDQKLQEKSQDQTKNHHKTQNLLAGLGKVQSGLSTAQESSRKTFNIFHKNRKEENSIIHNNHTSTNKSFMLFNVNTTPIQSNLAITRSQLRSSSTRYQKDRARMINTGTGGGLEKQSQFSNVSHTTNSQTHHIRNSSAMSVNSLQLNGSNLRMSSRPNSKMSNNRVGQSFHGGFFTPGVTPNRTNY
eukprot:403366361